MTIGVDTLPPLPKDAGDRNRTSPFAFTGNRFEFRAVGSSQSIAGPLVVLNTIMAESLRLLRRRAGEGHRRRSDEAARRRAESCSARSSRSTRPWSSTATATPAEWHEEAEKRGLPNLKTTVDALPTLIAEKNIKLFEKYNVLSEREMHSRYDIYLEQYVQGHQRGEPDRLEMAKTEILPAALTATRASWPDRRAT